MCGIIGIISKSKSQQSNAEAALQTLQKRGPDYQQLQSFSNIVLGHARLSIIDTSENAHQPFTDFSKRYTIVFNGEIYNYKALKDELLLDGVTFKSASDTEVLLYLFIKYGSDCLEKLNGFFAFAIYDNQTNSLFLARDRMGIKPLLYYFDGNDFIFSSALKSIMQFDIDKEYDKVSLFNYLQFNYIPSHHTILKAVKKLQPGCFLQIDNVNNITELKEKSYYQIPLNEKDTLQKNAFNYDKSKEILRNLLDESVKSRLIADVPVGTFLSGGVDSSIISLIAKRHKSDLNTFSIGYADEPYFDETIYAQTVAKKIGSNHHVFKLTNKELYDNLFDILDELDEPFADSSAIAVYMLSKYTKEHIDVALSGDGADEIFSGYNKHTAELNARHPGLKESLVKFGLPIWKKLPKSRNNQLTDWNRKLYKFSLGANLSNKERYWQWASIINEEKANFLLKEELIFKSQRLTDVAFDYKKRKEELLKYIRKDGDLNDVLYTDMQMVLPNDMLRKVDAMSMANSLEVRTPFLDHRLVNFAFNLPRAFKINSTMKKKILQDAFQDELPLEVYNRPKHGFEVPLLKWFRNELKDTIKNELLSDTFIEQQGVFNPSAIKELIDKLFSNNPEDSHATIWAIIVFNNWWKKYMVN